MHETNLKSEEAGELCHCQDPFGVCFTPFTIYKLTLILMAAWNSGRDPHCYMWQRLISVEPATLAL